MGHPDVGLLLDSDDSASQALDAADKEVSSVVVSTSASVVLSQRDTALHVPSISAWNFAFQIRLLPGVRKGSRYAGYLLWRPCATWDAQCAS